MADNQTLSTSTSGKTQSDGGEGLSIDFNSVGNFLQKQETLLSQFLGAQTAILKQMGYSGDSALPKKRHRDDDEISIGESSCNDPELTSQGDPWDRYHKSHIGAPSIDEVQVDPLDATNIRSEYASMIEQTAEPLGRDLTNQSLAALCNSTWGK